MNALKEYFKQQLIKGFAIKFNVPVNKNGVVTSNINNQLYSVILNNNLIMVNHYNENKVFAYVFDSLDKNEIFTRYKMLIEDGKLMITGSVYTYKDKVGHISTSGATITADEGSCLNDILFFANQYVNASPTNTIFKILSRKGTHLRDFQGEDKILVGTKNPFHTINKNESKYLKNNIIGRKK